jgi:hypothetical protein
MVHGRGADDEALAWYRNDSNYVIGFWRTATVAAIFSGHACRSTAAASLLT